MRIGNIRSRTIYGVSEWRRDHPREDDLRQPICQLFDSPWSLPWPTHEPRVRMDIQTAVQVSRMASPFDAVPVLLTTSNPAPVETQEWPAQPVAVENVITAGAELLHSIRMRRQARELDYPAHERRRANNDALVSLERQSQWLYIAGWVALVTGTLMGLATLVRSVM